MPRDDRPTRHADCPLCTSPGGRIVFEDTQWRLVHVDEDPGLHAFYRLIWREHVREWSDLDEARQMRCMRALTAVEKAMRQTIAPHKINLASLGNMVAHLHWHIIARYEWDGYFPNPVWAAPHTAPEQLPTERVQWLQAQRPALEARMIALLRGMDHDRA